MYSFGEAIIKKKNKTALVAIEAIASRIFVLRGQRVMLDADLAALYGVTTKRLNEQVRRNLERFPSDFMFQLKNQEVAILRSQFATSSSDPRSLAWGGRRYTPHAFTEHGALMVAMVLNSTRATDSTSWNQDSRENSPPTTRRSQASSMPSVSSWLRLSRPRSGASGSCRTTEVARIGRKGAARHAPCGTFVAQAGRWHRR